MRPGTPALALRYDPDAGFQLLPAVKPLEVSYREGARPSVAAFTYVSNNSYPDSYPIWIEHLLPMSAVGNPYLIFPDDRIVIATMGPEGLRFLFDGYAQLPEVSWTERRQDVTFQAQGVEIRAWDDQMTGFLMRNSSNYANANNNRIVESKIVFNPVVERESRGNMLIPGMGYEAENPESGRLYLPWAEPLIDKDITYTGDDNKEVKKSWRSFWTLAEAVNTILAHYNTRRDIIATPNREYLLKECSVVIPKSGSYYDPDDPTTFDVKDIVIPETDITDLSWPDAVGRLLRPNGFAMCFRLATYQGLPKTYLDIYRLEKPDRNNFKDVYLQPSGAMAAPGVNNASSGRLATDVSEIINQVIVRTAPIRYEVGFILAPLFKIDTVNDLTNKTKYDSRNDEAGVSEIPYRYFGVDECGEGYSAAPIYPAAGGNTFGDWQWVANKPFDLTPIFGLDLDDVPAYAERRRPTLSELWSKDKDNNYRKYRLYVSADYTGIYPTIWDGKSGTWFRVNNGFRNLDDRIGIRVTIQKPNEWSIGKPTEGVTYPKILTQNNIKLLNWLANPTLAQRMAFSLLLVCTIEGDHPLPVLAGKRDTSSTNFTITRTVDLSDRLRPGIIHPSSYFHPDKGATTAQPIECGNTEDDAYIYAQNKREAHQYGKVAGDIGIDRKSVV